MERSRNQLRAPRVEIAMSISMWVCPVISTTVRWHRISSTVPPARRSRTGQFTLHRLSWCSHTLLIVIVKGRQVSDVPLLRSVLSCIEVVWTTFIPSQTITVGDIVGTEHGRDIDRLRRDIDRLIGKRSFVNNLHLEFSYIAQIRTVAFLAVLSKTLYCHIILDHIWKLWTPFVHILVKWIIIVVPGLFYIVYSSI